MKRKAAVVGHINKQVKTGELPEEARRYVRLEVRTADCSTQTFWIAFHPANMRLLQAYLERHADRVLFCDPSATHQYLNDRQVALLVEHFPLSHLRIY